MHFLIGHLNPNPNNDTLLKYQLYIRSDIHDIIYKIKGCNIIR